MVFNIQSAKATLEYILGDYDAALSTLNSVLKKDPYHFLSLLRRSQVYKKVKNDQSLEKQTQKSSKGPRVYLCLLSRQSSNISIQSRDLALNPEARERTLDNF